MLRGPTDLRGLRLRAPLSQGVPLLSLRCPHTTQRYPPNSWVPPQNPDALRDSHRPTHSHSPLTSALCSSDIPTTPQGTPRITGCTRKDQRCFESPGETPSDPRTISMVLKCPPNPLECSHQPWIMPRPSKHPKKPPQLEHSHGSPWRPPKSQGPSQTSRMFPRSLRCPAPIAPQHP